VLESVAPGGVALHLSKLHVREGCSTEDMSIATRDSTGNCGLAMEMVDGEEQSKCGGKSANC
jgi:hypothetical protein